MLDFTILLMTAATGAVPEAPVDCPPDGRARALSNEKGEAHWCEAPSYFGGWSKDGEYKQWDPAGTLRVEGRYFTGRKDGQWSLYDADGVLMETRRYRNGKLVSREKMATAAAAAPAPERRTESPAQVSVDRTHSRIRLPRPPWLLSAAGPGKTTTLGLGGRLAVFLPMLDVTLRSGITDGFSFNLRGATVGLVNAVDLGFEGRLFRTRDASMSLLAGGTFTGVFAFGNESLALGPTPGFRLSFGGERFQFTTGLDVPLYVFTSISTAVVQGFGEAETFTASSTGLWMTVRPMLGVEFPVGDKTHMYIMAQLEQSVIEESGSTSLSYTLPYITVGASWDLAGGRGGGARSRDRFDF